MHLGARITKHDLDVSRWLLETHSFWGQQVKGQGRESQKLHRDGEWVFASLRAAAFSISVSLG